MKKQTGIWIDGKKAILVELSGENESISEIISQIEDAVHHPLEEGMKGSFQGTQHVSQERKIDERIHHQVDHYLNEVVDQLKGSDELFICGPGEIKLHLKKKIEAVKHLTEKLKAVESADKMSENQFVAKVKKFFAEK